MLSLVECRRLLGPSELRDEDVLELRALLYDLADVIELAQLQQAMAA